MPISKADIIDADIVDATELASDGTFVYLTLTVVSTTTGTKIVVVNLAPDGEGILHGDHPVEADDIVIITGTSGGLGDGTFTVASVTDDITFVVNEAIGTSTGGSADFIYPVGAGRVGFDPIGLLHITATNVQDAIEEIDAVIVTQDDFLLVVEPPAPDNDYTVTRTGSTVSQEKWSRLDTTKIKTIDYSYISGKVATEVRKVYATDGITITAQATLTYAYGMGLLNSYAWSRDI